MFTRRIILVDQLFFYTIQSVTMCCLQQVVEKTIVKPMPKVDDSRAVIKKPDSSSVAARPVRTAYEPIELPSTYAFGKFNKVTNNDTCETMFNYS